MIGAHISTQHFFSRNDIVSSFALIQARMGMLTPDTGCLFYSIAKLFEPEYCAPILYVMVCLSFFLARPLLKASHL